MPEHDADSLASSRSVSTAWLLIYLPNQTCTIYHHLVPHTQLAFMFLRMNCSLLPESTFSPCALGSILFHLFKEPTLMPLLDFLSLVSPLYRSLPPAEEYAVTPALLKKQSLPPFLDLPGCGPCFRSPLRQMLQKSCVHSLPQFS